MRPRAIGLISILAFGVPFAATAQSPVGEIVYLEEGVGIDRNGEHLDTGEVYIGAGVENYDLMSTDATGYAEVELTAPGSPQATVRVSPNTTFSFEIDRQGRDSRANVSLVAGSLAMKVQKLSGKQSLEVATGTALMGVRGTTFSVLLSPAGEVLVTTSEGSVSCTDEEGRELLAQPGQAVEQLPEEGFQSIPVAVSSLEEFQRDWYADRLAVFKANALKAIRQYALRYLELRGRFAEGYEALQEEQDVLRRWYAQDRQGVIGGRMELMRDKKRIIGRLFALRKTLYLFERVYYRLDELERYYRQGYGRGSVQPGLSTEEFFQAFDRDRRTLAQQMVTVRYITKLYALRNEGRFPTDHFEEGEKDFFGGDEGFLHAEDDDFSF